MASLGIRSSITEAKLKRFVDTASEGQELSCERIKGLSVYKNRSAGSASFRYRPTSRHLRRTPITIGKTSEIKIQEAAKISISLIEAINNGENPKQALVSMLDGRLYSIAVDKADLLLLGNFFYQVYKPLRLRESGQSAVSAMNSIEKQWGHLFSRPMSQIKPIDVQQWQSEKEQQGLKYTTIEKYYVLLRAMLSTAVTMSHEVGNSCFGLLDDLPFKVRPLRKPSKAQKERELTLARDLEIKKRRVMEPEELLAIEGALYRYGRQVVAMRSRTRKHSNKRHLQPLEDVEFPHWIIPFVYIAYYTGMRAGDISTLRWEDIQNGKIRKVANKSKNLAKPIILNLDISETANLLKYSLKEVLEIWHSQQSYRTKGFIFPQNRDPSNPLSEKGYKKSWKKVKDLAGIDIDMYAFRHHFISTHVRRGTNLKLIATLVGHRTTEMIERYYAHHFPSDIREALSIM